MAARMTALSPAAAATPRFLVSSTSFSNCSSVLAACLRAALARFLSTPCAFRAAGPLGFFTRALVAAAFDFRPVWVFQQLAETAQRPQLHLGTIAGKVEVARLIGVGFHRLRLVVNVLHLIDFDDSGKCRFGRDVMDYRLSTGALRSLSRWSCSAAMALEVPKEIVESMVATGSEPFPKLVTDALTRAWPCRERIGNAGALKSIHACRRYARTSVYEKPIGHRF